MKTRIKTFFNIEVLQFEVYLHLSFFKLERYCMCKSSPQHSHKFVSANDEFTFKCMGNY